MTAEIINLSFKDGKIYATVRTADNITFEFQANAKQISLEQESDYETTYWTNKDKKSYYLMGQRFNIVIPLLIKSLDEPFIEFRALEDKNERTGTNANAAKHRRCDRGNKRNHRKQNKNEPRPTKKNYETSGQNRKASPS